MKSLIAVLTFLCATQAFAATDSRLRIKVQKTNGTHGSRLVKDLSIMCDKGQCDLRYMTMGVRLANRVEGAGDVKVIFEILVGNVYWESSVWMTPYSINDGRGVELRANLKPANGQGKANPLKIIIPDNYRPSEATIFYNRHAVLSGILGF